MISIILIEPKNSGNLGAVARAMKNFSLENLILISPKCKKDSKEARNRAKHAQEILKKAKIKDRKYLKTFDYLIATTSQIGTDYNIPRSPITAEKLAEKLNKIQKLNIGILFGRESSGLTNEEISGCDFVVTIPSNPEYPVLNLSQSAGIILYELFKNSKKKKTHEHIVFATKKEKQIILEHFNKILKKIKFATKEKKETQKKVWKRIIGKSFLTKREAYAVIGFYKKLR